VIAVQGLADLEGHFVNDA